MIEVTEESKCEKTGIIINYKIILFNKEKMVYKLISYDTYNSNKESIHYKAIKELKEIFEDEHSNYHCKPYEHLIKKYYNKE